jgi:hypothetical protein
LRLGLCLGLALIGTTATKAPLPSATTAAITTVSALGNLNLRDWLGPLRNYLLNLHFHCAFNLAFGPRFAAFVDSLNALIAAISLRMGGHEADRGQQQSKGEITHRL